MRILTTSLLIAAMAGLPARAEPAPRRSPERAGARIPEASDLARMTEAPGMTAIAQRFEETRLRLLYGDDWDEAIVEIAADDIATVLGRHGGSWRARGLGRQALKKPQSRRAIEWYLDLSVDPAVTRIEPNPRAVHPGCRQMSIDILESGSQLIPDLASQPALAPTAAEGLDAGGIIVAILDSGVAPLDAFGDALLPAIDMLHPRAPFVMWDKDDLGQLSADANGHGTAMATLVASVAEGALLQPVRVVGADCVGTAFDVAAGMTAAADAGARVVLVSLSTRHDSPLLRRSVADVQARGVLIVAAAGNDGQVEYPAAYPGVLAVTAIGADGWPPAFAPQGAGISLAAPGVGIVAVGPDSGMSLTGTSPAAALVAGAAARVARLLDEAGPDAWSAALLAATTPAGEISPGLEGRLGAGCLDFTPLK